VLLQDLQVLEVFRKRKNYFKICIVRFSSTCLCLELGKKGNAQIGIVFVNLNVRLLSVEVRYWHRKLLKIEHCYFVPSVVQYLVLKYLGTNLVK
jgi:hypothetical protein